MRVKNIDSEAESKTKILIDTPKTDSSERKIPIPNFISDILSSMRRKASSVDSYVLTGNEKYIEPRNYYMKYKLCLKECGIGEYTFHTLRHTFATRAVECGFDVKALSEILGHSDVKIILERYVHPSMDLKRSYMNKMIDKL